MTPNIVDDAFAKRYIVGLLISYDDCCENAHVFIILAWALKDIMMLARARNATGLFVSIKVGTKELQYYTKFKLNSTFLKTPPSLSTSVLNKTQQFLASDIHASSSSGMEYHHIQSDK